MAGAVWRRRGDVAYVESPGRVALLDLRRPGHPPVVLEDSAAAIWRLLDGVRDEDDLSRALSEEYAVTPEEAAPAVGGFLASLSEVGLAERA